MLLHYLVKKLLSES